MDAGEYGASGQSALTHPVPGYLLPLPQGPVPSPAMFQRKCERHQPTTNKEEGVSHRAAQSQKAVGSGTNVPGSVAQSATTHRSLGR